MARFFKRRRHKGPSKNEKKVARRLDDGPRLAPLNERLPGVSELSLEIQYTDAEGRPFRTTKRVFRGADQLELELTCPGVCGGTGTIDLEPKLQAMVEAGTESDTGSAECTMDRYGSPGEPCGFKLDCAISLRY